MSSADAAPFEPPRSARGHECKICVRQGNYCNYHASRLAPGGINGADANAAKVASSQYKSKTTAVSPSKRPASDDGGKANKAARGTGQPPSPDAAMSSLKCPYCAKRFQRRLVLKVVATLCKSLV